MKKIISGISFCLLFFNCSNPSIDIKAKVYRTLLGISVENHDSFEWRDISVEINEDYSYKISTIDPGGEKTIPLSNFAKADGERFNIKEKKITSLSISCKVKEDDLGFAYFTLDE